MILTHPYYEDCLEDWVKYRAVYTGGSYFVEKYLKKYSEREDATTFQARKEMSPVPAFAAAAVDEIKDSIFQRLSDVSRAGGPISYQQSVKGSGMGVDREGRSMTDFIGAFVLPELLSMGRVGIFVDMPEITGTTLADTANESPYIYTYKCEDIPCWDCDRDTYKNVLLTDYVYTYDKRTGLPTGRVERKRHMWIDDRGKVSVRYFDNFIERGSEIIKLDIDRIPFYIFDIRKSLLCNVANHQIALLSLGSSDVSYALSSNFPFYTEQYDPNEANAFLGTAGTAAPGTSLDGDTSKNRVVPTGPKRGRRYPKDLERPGFINPSSEPLEVSMKKQDQLKTEIRQLVHLAVSNLQTRNASAVSKDFDNRSLEAGLSFIGLELENGERRIGEYWSMYTKSKPPTINYPQNYSLKTDEERREEIKALKEIIPTVPSLTFKRIVAKRIAFLSVGLKVSDSELERIYKEIDKAPAISTTIEKDVEQGLVSKKVAAQILCYPEGDVEVANIEHADRLTRIATSQSQGLTNPSARGITDLGSQNDGSIEKKKANDNTQKGDVRKSQRGPNK